MIYFHPMTPTLGYLPYFWSDNDPRSAAEQAHDRYAHGGGWRPFDGFTVSQDEAGVFTISYPGDPDYREVSRATLRDELIVVFPYSWVMVVNKDDMSQHEIARMD